MQPARGSLHLFFSELCTISAIVFSSQPFERHGGLRVAERAEGGRRRGTGGVQEELEFESNHCKDEIEWDWSL
jgi:hypothetical protein